MNKFAVSFWKNIVPERHICISLRVHGAVRGRSSGPCGNKLELAGPRRGSTA